jgi:WD40 repeat protein
MNQSPRVFISYARSDGERFATALRQRLEREEPEITLWQDRAQMEGGKDWWRQILEALDAVEFMVLVMTPGALASPVVRKEWQAARQCGVCVYPVMGAPNLDFDAMPRWMSRAHFFDLDKEWQTFVNYLKSPCTAVRAPFMAPDLPEGHVERARLISQLLDAILDETQENARPGAAVLYGAGGFGKTTLAAALCHHDAVLTAYDAGVLWVTLGEQPNLLNELTSLYAALTDERPGFASEPDAAVHLAEKLGEANTLLVIDDVWNAAHLEPFMRGGPGCARLVTTRQFEVAARFGTRLEVYEMGTDEAARMLTARLPQAPTDLAPFRALARRLGEWPLMLELAGAALRQRVARGDTLPGALAHLNQALDRRGMVAFDRSDAVARNQALARSMAVSLDLLAEEERRRYLELAIFPEDVDVPPSALGALWGTDAFDTEALAERMADLSLLRYDLPGGAVRLHDVVRAYLAGQLGDPAALHAGLVDGWGDPHHLPDAYAWRWIGYHLVAAGRREALRALLFDYAWLRAKLAATGVNALLADYERLPKDPAAQRVGRALRQAAHVLAAGPAQLVWQMLGRLVDDRAPEVGALLAQATAAQQGVWLRPLQASLRDPEVLVRTLTGHTGFVSGVAVTPDGRYAISASEDETLKVWDLHTGQAVRTLEGHASWVYDVALTPDGRYAVSASMDKTLKVWDLAAALQAGPGMSQAVHSLEGHTDFVSGVAVTPDGRYAISASEDGTLKVWDLAAALSAGQGTSQAVHTLEGHTGPVTGVAVTPDGRYAVSASGDWTLKVWDLAAALSAGQGTSKAVHTLEGHADAVRSVAVTPDGRYAVSASSDRTLKVWDLAAALEPDLGQGEGVGPGTSQAVHTLEGHAFNVAGVAITPDGHYAISASFDKTLKMWDLSTVLKAGLSAALKPGTNQAVHTLAGHAWAITSVAVTPDGRYAVSASWDRTLKVWNLSTVLKPGPPAPAAQPVLASGPGAQVSKGEGTGPGTGQVIRTLAGHLGFVNGVTVTPDGHYAVSASGDRTLKVWDLAAALTAGRGTDRAVHTLKGHTGLVSSVALTPDGRFAVSASRDNTLKVWDLSTALKLGLSAPTTQAQVSKGKDTSPLAPRKRKAGLRTGQAVHTLAGHTSYVNGVALTPDGRYAISASQDQTLKVWDLAASKSGLPAPAAQTQVSKGEGTSPGTSQALHTLTGHTGGVAGVAVTPDGRYAVSASLDHTLKVWDLSTALKPGLNKSVSTRTSPAVRTLEGHTSGVSGVAVTQDGHYAVSASGDGTLRVWELASGQLLTSFYAGEPLYACAVAPDGVTVVAGGASGRLHVLRLEGLERAETDG